MEANNPYMSLPGVTLEELTIIEQTTAGLNETQKQYFFGVYTNKRKSADDVRMYCLIAIIIPGFQRFMLEQIAWAVLYFFTGGLFFVMTVMDLINYKQLANEYNQKAAFESFQLAKMAK